jgi:hypothetical protein
MPDYQSGDKSDKSPHSMSDGGKINWSAATCRRFSSQSYEFETVSMPRGPT